MKALDVRVANRLGLHARAAARFVQCAHRFQARISVSQGATKVDGKSILGLLTLAAPQGARLRLVADGADEDLALEELGRLVTERFGEAG